jgi:hypothetical protein
MHNLSEVILLRLSAARLDADLAAGMSPETSSRHATRARRLVSPRTRHALASDWEHLLSVSHGTTPGLSGRVPIRRERLHQAEPEIRELIEALRASGPVPARGVAIATNLLTDGRGPIYNAKAPNDLTATVMRAVVHLNPALPLIDGPIEPALCG